MGKPESGPPKGNGQNAPPPQWRWIVLAVWAAFGLAVIYGPRNATERQPETLSYSALKEMVRDGNVTSAILDPKAITVTGAPGADDLRYRAFVPTQGDPELLPLLESSGVEVTAEPPREVSVFAYMLPWVALLGLYVWYQRRMLGQIGGFGAAGGLFAGRFAQPSQTEPDVTFDDVAGQDQAKRDVAELVDFLREPERFGKVGAEVPHGVLLMGPPGTGKTLLARALAGEAGVPFFSTSGSEFIEVYVGVGAGRVRRMFEAARKAAPSVIFIDELDSIGRTRGTGLGGGHDEREQTLNQILAELDGFRGKEAVVVLAATNRPDVLDPALIRPGRFDRHVTLELPDRASRRAILEIHARDLPLADRTDLDAIAAGTPGFSGADLKNLLNEAAIDAARRHADTILAADLQDARDRVMLGTVRTLAIQPEERQRLAVHEAGHAAAAFYSPGADPLYKVTIVPRGRSLGGTHTLAEVERHTLPEGYLRTQLVILLAGRAAEKQLIGSTSSGADDDIKRATELARAMVARWGMDETLGPIDLRQQEDHPFLGQSMALPHSFADETAAQVDRAVMNLLKESERAATAIISEHEAEIRLLIRDLEANEVLDFDRVRACLTSNDKVRPLERPNRARPRAEQQGESRTRDD